MMLELGSAVEKDCRQLGKFPAGAVGSFKSLELFSPSYDTGHLFLASQRNQIRNRLQIGQTTEDHLGKGVLICNDEWGKRGRPLSCWMRRRVRKVGLTLCRSQFVVGGISTAPTGQRNLREWTWNQGLTVLEQDNLDSGRFEFDLYTGDGVVDSGELESVPPFFTYSDLAASATVDYILVDPTDPDSTRFTATLTVNGQYMYGSEINSQTRTSTFIIQMQVSALRVDYPVWGIDRLGRATMEATLLVHVGCYFEDVPPDDPPEEEE
jgi:hypothetical protein